MQAIRHLALGVCVLCALAGVVRIFWPENSYKPVINTVLLLYIVSSVLSVGSTADWAGFAAGLRSFRCNRRKRRILPHTGKASRDRLRPKRSVPCLRNRG